MHKPLNLDEYLYNQWRQWEDLHQRTNEFRAKVKEHLLRAGQHELVLELGFLVETMHTNEKQARGEYDAF